MAPDDPRTIERWYELDEITVTALSPIQLIAYVHHNLRQKVAVTAGWGQLLAQGVFGFVSQEQQNAIEQVQTNIRAIEQIHQDIDRWLAARIDQDGNWLSDEYGRLAPEKP
jgi:hypothetical protein